MKYLLLLLFPVSVSGQWFLDSKKLNTVNQQAKFIVSSALNIPDEDLICGNALYKDSASTIFHKIEKRGTIADILPPNDPRLKEIGRVEITKLSDEPAAYSTSTSDSVLIYLPLTAKAMPWDNFFHKRQVGSQFIYSFSAHAFK